LEIVMARSERPGRRRHAGGKTIVLTQENIDEAARLLELLVGDAADSVIPSKDTYDRQRLLAKARQQLEQRAHRANYFNRAIFGETAWDILLVLYVTGFSGPRQTIGKLARWIDTPPTTVVRWVDYLEKERLVRREPHPNDKRIIFISLLDKGGEALEDYLASLNS